MLAPDYQPHPESGAERDFRDHEDFEAPANWALDDFTDILPYRQVTGEVLQ